MRTGAYFNFDADPELAKVVLTWLASPVFFVAYRTYFNRKIKQFC